MLRFGSPATKNPLHFMPYENLLLHPSIHDYSLFTRLQPVHCRLPRDRCLQCIVASVRSANRSGGGIHKWATHFMAVQVLSRAQDGTSPRIASALLPSVRTRANRRPFHSYPLREVPPPTSVQISLQSDTTDTSGPDIHKLSRYQGRATTRAPRAQPSTGHCRPTRAQRSHRP